MVNDTYKPTYEIFGAGKPLVYVCGIEGSGKNFFRQIPDLSLDHRIVTFPHRPYGNYGLDTLVEDVRCIMVDACIKRATFLGESFGGLVVLATALAHPELVERMLLVNTFARFLNPLKVRLGIAAYSVFPALTKAIRRMSSGHELFSSDISSESRQRFLLNTSNVTSAGYLSRLRIIANSDLLPRLCELNMPAVLAASTRDKMLDSVTCARMMAEQLPHARVKVLEGTGHTALLSDRVKVRELLAEFEQM